MTKSARAFLIAAIRLTVQEITNDPTLYGDDPTLEEIETGATEILQWLEAGL